MKNFIAKLKAFIQLITPWINFGIQEYKNVKEEIKAEKANQKQMH